MTTKTSSEKRQSYLSSRKVKGIGRKNTSDTETVQSAKRTVSVDAAVRV